VCRPWFSAPRLLTAVAASPKKKAVAISFPLPVVGRYVAGLVDPFAGFAIGSRRGPRGGPGPMPHDRSCRGGRKRGRYDTLGGGCSGRRPDQDVHLLQPEVRRHASRATSARTMIGTPTLDLRTVAGQRGGKLGPGGSPASSDGHGAARSPVHRRVTPPTTTLPARCAGEGARSDLPRPSHPSPAGRGLCVTRLSGAVIRLSGARTAVPSGHCHDERGHPTRTCSRAAGLAGRRLGLSACSTGGDCRSLP